MINNLENQNVSKVLLNQVIKYKEQFPYEGIFEYRIPNNEITYLGKEIWEQAITAILQGSNLLLVGPKSTGKNLLASNLSQLFNRPSWNISLNINTDESQLLGTDTFKNNEVVFRDGPVLSACKSGGYVILDEINMAKNEALSVLHATLDDRRIIDIPGYDLVDIHPSTRFIATMNYGYLGTRDLNEALISRFSVIELPHINEEQIISLLKNRNPNLKDSFSQRLAKFFKDIELKVENSEISSRALDLRGLLSSVDSIDIGLDVRNALTIAITNKTFDSFEKGLISDLINLNFPTQLTRSDIFE